MLYTHHMDSTSSLHHHHHHPTAAAACGIFDSALLRQQSTIPTQFLWPRTDVRPHATDELDAPIIDLQGFLAGDKAATASAAALVRSACSAHGFFQVTNHGVDASLAEEALRCIHSFFNLPAADKLQAKRARGSTWGYASAHADRFASKLPWKETLSFGHRKRGAEQGITNYFTSVLGEDFEPMGLVYQRYSEELMELSMSIVELLEISLGVDKGCYREFLEDGCSIVRCNYYPPCQEPELTLGTGPHSDPTALTVLQQDEVGGLEVLVGGEWRSVSPVAGALVINIGDTFMALSNGRYKSCLHRAVVNRHNDRRSIAFFVCPRGDRVLRPPEELIDDRGREYPDFTWSELLEFTQSRYRADTTTLQSFVQWRHSMMNNTDKP